MPAPYIISQTFALLLVVARPTGYRCLVLHQSLHMRSDPEGRQAGPRPLAVARVCSYADACARAESGPPRCGGRSAHANQARRHAFHTSHSILRTLMFPAMFAASLYAHCNDHTGARVLRSTHVKAGTITPCLIGTVGSRKPVADVASASKPGEAPWFFYDLKNLAMRVSRRALGV